MSTTKNSLLSIHNAHFAPLLILMLCTTAVYFNHFDNSFHFDDSHTIVNNTSIRTLQNIPKFFADGSTFSSLPANQSYRPVVTTLNAIDYSLSASSNNKTRWFHISIFLSFLLCGLLLFLLLDHLLSKLGDKRYTRHISLFITAWFWLHPANAETINYIIARSDSFSTCMVLLSFVMYTMWDKGRENFLYLVPFIVGFLSKETAIIFLPLLFLYELYFNPDTRHSIFSFKKLSHAFGKVFVTLVVSIGLLVLYRFMQPSSWEPGGVMHKVGYWLTQPFAWLHYAGNFIVPANLVVDTDWSLVNSITDKRFITGCLFLLVLFIVAIITSIKSSWRVVGFGLCWFILALLPTSFIPLAEVINDHRTFFPYIGLFIAAGGLLQQLIIHNEHLLIYKGSRLLMQGILVLFFAALALTTWKRNRVWHSEMTLWKEVTIKAPMNGRGWMNYGLSQMNIGDYQGAEISFRKAEALNPGYPYVYINLGILNSMTGRPGEADEYFRTALTFGAHNPESYAWYAEFLLKNNRKAEAASLIKKGLKISPHHEMLLGLEKLVVDR